MDTTKQNTAPETTPQTILYKLDSNNNMREWCCWTENTTLIIRYGLLNGQKVFEQLDYSNPGLAQEHARRRITKQLDRRGYTREIPTSRQLRPMLAHTYQKHGHKLPENIIIQPKLEGYRSLGTSKKMITRTKATLPAFPHIEHCLKFLPEDIVLDGEIYNHGSRFQSIMKSRSNLMTQDSLMMEYHVFDCVEPSMPYHARRVLVSEIVMELMDQYEKKPFTTAFGVCPFPIQAVQTNAAKLHEIPFYMEKYTKDKYEGIMIRDPNAHYEIDTRSYGMLKYKERDEDYYKVVDVVPGPKRKAEGVLVCVTSQGRSFRCTIKGTQTDRERALRFPSNWVGKYVIVEYRGFTDDDLPKEAVARLPPAM